ncbi:MAG: PQQ-dependent sugar dehydrogenase [Armatimonadetes bacterium]|nr:PQQ-dependent sugar dehydrogenase [Armatimonadota bacterium]
MTTTLAALTIAALTPGLQQGRSVRELPSVVQTQAGPLSVAVLARLNEPWGMDFLPDGRLLITEKPGRLRIYADGRLSGPVPGVPTVAYGGQGGLLDVAVDPDFVQNAMVYLSYAEAASEQPAGEKDEWDPRLGEQPKPVDNVVKGGAVARALLTDGRLTSVKVIWRQFPKTVGRGHYGGRIVFKGDGTIFVTSGERQRFTPAQDMASNLGKVVRIHRDGSIPKDNPFVGRKGARADVWSSGHRNPLGAALRPGTGKLWIHEMGPRHGDEMNVPAAGKNYGWPIVSNGDHYNGGHIPDHATAPQYAAPAFYWYPAISPSGLMFYTGDLFPDWKGNAFLGSLSTEVLVREKLEGDAFVQEERIDLRRRIRDVIQAPDGSIYVLTDYKEGGLLRLSPAVR